MKKVLFFLSFSVLIGNRVNAAASDSSRGGKLARKKVINHLEHLITKKDPKNKIHETLEAWDKQLKSTPMDKLPSPEEIACLRAIMQAGKNAAEDLTPDNSLLVKERFNQEVKALISPHTAAAEQIVKKAEKTPAGSYCIVG